MVMLSELRRFRLRDERHAEAALTDLSLDLASDEYPRATGILFRRSLKQLAELPWDAVTSIDWRARRILVTDLQGAHDLDEDALERAVLIDRDILDALILDIPQRESMRANDQTVVKAATSSAGDVASRDAARRR